MPTSNLRSSQVNARIAAFLTLLICCFLFGGSSRADTYSQFFVRAAAIVIGAIALYWLSRSHLRPIKIPFWLTVGWTGLILLQLIPLPPSLWLSLPGREPFANLAQIAQFSQPWRPISLVPDATANSALSMIVPLAILLSFAHFPRERVFLLVGAIVGLVVVTGTIGVAQVAAGGTFYFYDISNRGDAVGIFANRNHQAALLAASVPLLAGMACYPRTEPSNISGIVTGIVYILIFPLLFITGSRSGVFLLMAGSLIGYLIFWKVNSVYLRRFGSRRFGMSVGQIGLLLVAVAGGLLTIFRVGAIERMVTMDVSEDLRIGLLPTMVNMAIRYFPAGAGFGTFPDVFKIDEPGWALSPRYLNHAHNDYLEIVIEGGGPAVILVALGLIWFAWATFTVWRAPFGVSNRRIHLMGLVGSAVIALLSLASITDYPLRTPFLAALFALAASFLSVAVYEIKGRVEKPVAPS